MAMRRWVRVRWEGVLLSLLWGLSVVPQPGHSAALFSNGPHTCTTLNCRATRLEVAVPSPSQQGGPYPPPVTLDVWGVGEGCLRVEAETQGTANADLLIKLISPSGWIWVSENGWRVPQGRSVLKVDPAPESGVYTVVITSPRRVTGRFSLRYGNWNAGNINCSDATVPIFQYIPCPAQSLCTPP